MGSSAQRALAVLEFVAEHPQGCTISQIAEALSFPISATHRALAELLGEGYVRQTRSQGPYQLSLKLVTIGLGFLSRSGITDIAQPVLDDLAHLSGELVRLAVVDRTDLVFVAKSQGASGPLRYDPDMGLAVQLSCSAAGHAWLSTMKEDDALRLVYAQGFGSPARFGPRAPQTARELLGYIEAARARRYAMIVEQFAPGMSSMSVPIIGRDDVAMGVLTIAGPTFRLTETRMTELSGPLIDAARTVSRTSSASALFRQPPDTLA